LIDAEVKLINQLLLSWGAWARHDGIKLKATTAGELWQIQSLIEGKDYLIQLSDDAFLLIDAAIAKLPQRLKGIIDLEYRSNLPTYAKLRKLGLNRLACRQRLNAAQWALYAQLYPFLDGWRQ
jgi:hypothetical protein